MSNFCPGRIPINSVIIGNNVKNFTANNKNISKNGKNNKNLKKNKNLKNNNNRNINNGKFPYYIVVIKFSIKFIRIKFKSFHTT